MKRWRAAAQSAAISALVLMAGCGSGGNTDTVAVPTQPAPPACPSQLGTGYQVTTIAGIKAAVWYPTTQAEAAFNYSSSTSTTLASNAVPTTCQRFPLVVFSHGLFGCGTQSLFVTETLARSGYVVVAPDHPDALCSVDGAPPSGTTVHEPSVADPAAWTDTTYADRFQQVRNLLDTLLTNSTWTTQIDPARIGIAGHSLGGYTAFGTVGGWARWKDDRVKAALLLSPYVLPYHLQNRIAAVQVPVMYQGAQFDLGITPTLLGPNGVYAVSNPPKYFVELFLAAHFEWTNLACLASATIAGCLQTQPNPKLLSDYSNAFFDRYLKGSDPPLLNGSGAGLLLYQKQLQ